MNPNDGFFFDNTIKNMLKNVKFCKTHLIFEAVSVKMVILDYISYIL